MELILLNKKTLVNIFVVAVGLWLLGSYFIEHRWLELFGLLIIIVYALVVNNRSRK